MAEIIKNIIYDSTTQNINTKIEIRATIEEQSAQNNTSKIDIGAYLCITNNNSSYITAYYKGSGSKTYLEQQVAYTNTSDSIPITVNGVAGTYPGATGDYFSRVYTNGYNNSVSIGAGESFEVEIYPVNFSGTTIYHNVDGTVQLELYMNYFYVWASIGGSGTYTLFKGSSFDGVVTLPTINRALLPITADNFNDEGNPSFSYEVTTAKSLGYYMDDGWDGAFVYPTEEGVNDTVTSLYAALSFDGETIDIPYREVPLNKTSYTFDLTEAEREILRQKAQGSSTVPIYYMTKVTRAVNYSYTNSTNKLSEYYATADFFGKVQRNLTIIGCNPSSNPTVKDIKEETLALTGDENTFVRYESMAEYAINATASKHATIVSQSVTCGSKTIDDLPYGVIEDVESGTFNFYVLDSRGLAASTAVFKNLVEYVKPTCYQKLTMEMASEFGSRVVLKVNGNYYSGSFGAVDNTLLIETRYTDGNGNWGEWQTITETPTFNNDTYSVETTIEGFSYSKAYVFQCRVTDKLNVVQSAQYTLRIYPVFDWGESDFNFNVPVKMNGKTVLRHGIDTDNTVLSASGGHIYIRPGGTDNTSGETIIYPDGRIQFGGEVTFADGTTGGGSSAPTDLADYVIETGEEAMGSNGTWYWRKWASGKSECWGCRNFGNMAVTTAWGNLYRSAIFTQDLPEDVFARTPDSININIVHGGYGGWICKHEQTAPSAITTGSFIYVRPASATVTPSNLGFHIIGEWK